MAIESSIDVQAAAMGHIRVRDLGKAYKRYPHKWGRLAEWIGFRSQHQLKWVLQDVTFDVAPGEAVGIIGFNGAGKSTLLKIICGTTQPTMGDVGVGGRISALLELGMGFHPDFTGRQNAYMAGQLRGMTTGELDACMRDIETFADIGDYIDQPLRTYSSGMQVRLAFSVATAARPEILIVDEALAVGDILFQQKCFDRIREFCRAGTTLLFVSHSLATVHSLCDRALLVHEGRLLLDDRSKAAIDLYNALTLRERDAEPASLRITAGGTVSSSQTASGEPFHEASPEGVRVSPPDGSSAAQGMATQPPAGSFSKPGASVASVVLLHDGRPVESFISEDTVTVAIGARFDVEFDDPHVGFQIRNARGETLFMTNTHCVGMPIGSVHPGDEVHVTFRFRAALAPGDYSLTVGIANGGLLEGHFRQALTRTHDIRTFTVLRNLDSILWSGVYNLAPECSVQRATVPVTLGSSTSR